MRDILVLGCIVTALAAVTVVALLRHQADYYWINRFKPTKRRTTHDYLNLCCKRKYQAGTVACVGGTLLIIQAFIIVATIP